MLRIFAIHDSGVASFSAPFFVNHVQHAMRYFETLCKDPKSDLGKFPGSFNLFELGEFDEENGSFNLHTAPIKTLSGLQFKQE